MTHPSGGRRPGPDGYRWCNQPAVALGRGYAVFGSDSGHVADPLHPGAFAWNEEALANYAHDALKKTRDTAIELIRLRYGAAPERSYFAGGSTGGREALAVVQQWPLAFHP